MKEKLNFDESAMNDYLPALFRKTPWEFLVPYCGTGTLLLGLTTRPLPTETLASAMLSRFAKREGRSVSQVCDMLLTIGVREYEKSGTTYLHKTLREEEEDGRR